MLLLLSGRGFHGHHTKCLFHRLDHAAKRKVRDDACFETVPIVLFLIAAKLGFSSINPQAS
jgi:hypothetical protein